MLIWILYSLLLPLIPAAPFMISCMYCSIIMLWGHDMMGHVVFFAIACAKEVSGTSDKKKRRSIKKEEQGRRSTRERDEERGNFETSTYY